MTTTLHEIWLKKVKAREIKIKIKRIMDDDGNFVWALFENGELQHETNFSATGRNSIPKKDVINFL